MIWNERRFIRENGHLEGIPVGEQIEDQGLDLARMDALQMKKIEQAYQYLFIFREKYRNLKEDNEQLRQRLKVVEKRLKELEKRVDNDKTGE